MNLAFDLFLLIFNLSQIHDKEKIIQLFIEGIQEIFKPAIFEYCEDSMPDSDFSFEIKTGKSFFGTMTAVGSVVLDKTHKILIINSVQMIAVMLERLEFEQRLEKEKEMVL